MKKIYMKKIYKIIASISVFLIVLFVGVVLVVGNTNKKANAGLIVESNFGNFTNFQGANAADLQGKYFGFNYFKFYGSFEFQGSWNTGSGTTSGAMFQIRDIGHVNDKAILHARWSQQTSWDSSIQCYFTTYNGTTYVVFDILQLISNVLADGGTQGENITILSIYSNGLAVYNPVICEISNTIAQVSNLQDLKNNQLSIYYLQDLSNLSSTLTNEATINYGFIDENDNTLYSVYTKYIQIAYDSPENTLTFDIPETNTNYVFSNTYDYDGETFSAWSIDYNIYVIWVWHNNNTIKWGIGLCSHSPLYTNNMITSITEIYSLTASNSTTMTCRITDNENLNFITINNIDLTGDFPLSQVNQALKSGGIIPAYAYYQYVSGRNTGFSLGETSATRYWQDYYGSGGEGYDAIFEAGKQAGIAENIGTKDWFITAFGAVDAFLNIRIFPNITFGILLGIPFIISVVWFIIRMFRGGGGGD